MEDRDLGQMIKALEQQVDTLTKEVAGLKAMLEPSNLLQLLDEAQKRYG